MLYIPQMSPILWMMPIVLLITLLLTTKTNMTPTNEYESKTTQKKNTTTHMEWKW